MTNYHPIALLVVAFQLLSFPSLINTSNSFRVVLASSTTNETTLENSAARNHENLTLNPVVVNGTTTPRTFTTSISNDTTFTPSPEVQHLTEILNDTILHIHEIVINYKRNMSQEGLRDFERVGAILHTMATFMSEKGINLSQDVETDIEQELIGIRNFIMDHTHKFHNLSNTNTTTTLSHGHGHHVNGTNDSQTETRIPSSVGVENVTNPGIRNDIKRHRKTFTPWMAKQSDGMLQNFMQFSAKVGEDLRTSITGTNNPITTTINQIQTQIQSFLNGISNFLSTAATRIPPKPTFNLTIPSFNFTKPTFTFTKPPQLFRRQEILSQ